MATALVAGANGIIGRNLVEHLSREAGWAPIAASRSPLDYESRARYVSLDLTDPTAVAGRARELADVTHVFYAAYSERSTLAEQTAVNTDMLRHLVDGLESVATRLERVVFIQGGKAYGAHLGRYRTPAHETDPRHFPPNFYYAQEDYLREKSRGKAWSWTAVRPDMVIGFAVGNPMNLANLIAVYATLCRELKVPFRFPGPPEAYDALVNVTGADLLADAMTWMSREENCRGEILNVTNGDVFRWAHVWPRFAEFFGAELAEPLTFPLREYMADKGPLWAELVRRHGLRDHRLEDLAQWGFGDFIFNNRYDAFFDVNKARRLGYHRMCLDSGDHFLRTFARLREDKIIP